MAIEHRVETAAYLPDQSGKEFTAEEIADWRFEEVGEWGHPAHQQMVRSVRVDEDAPAGLPPVGLATRGRRWLARQIAP